MNKLTPLSTLPVLALGLFVACTVGDGSSKLGGDEGSGAASSSSASNSSSSETSGTESTGSFDPNGSSSNSTASGVPCDSTPDSDIDADGFTPSQGDCNDCDANVNPAAIEVIVDDPDAPQADENCNDQVDEPRVLCDDGIALEEFDPNKGAAALDLCHSVANDGFGLISAQYVRANGTPLTAASQHIGVMEGFGANVTARAGSRMLALSSGHARTPGQPGVCTNVSCGDYGTGTAPAGFPQNVPGCPDGTIIQDDVGLEVVLKAPSNANGFQYEFSFYSHEYPEWVCDSYNDQYVALVTPAPAGAINGNISFDSQTNPVSVNIALFEVCEGCALGTDELIGTGFDTLGGGVGDSGATGWLVSTAPIDPGAETTIRFAIWDTTDANFDSTVIIDNFQWIADGGSVSVGTVPVPE